VLPLPGALPDMTSTTASYVALQRAYRDKAMQDLAELSEAVDRVLLSLGRSRESMSRCGSLGLAL
jgi:amyloid beta precursor protein binding protein 1